MLGTANGFAAYQKGMFIPIASTFFMFWLYAAPAVRMSALQGLRFIGIATHDSIGIGEDGMWPRRVYVALANEYLCRPHPSANRSCSVLPCFAQHQLDPPL